MEKLTDLTLKQYLANASTKEPNPGGGSVAAYVAGLGASLAVMVLELSYGKKAFEAVDEKIRQEMEVQKKEFLEEVKKLEVYTDEDSKSFNKVLDAYKLPKETDEEKKVRDEAIQEGYKYALDVPLNVARISSKVLNKLDHFVSYGSVYAITDIGCAILFLASSVEAALFNVNINLKSIKDKEFVEKTSKEMEELVENAHKMRDKYLAETYDRLK